MSFKKWKAVFENEELVKVASEIQSNIVDDLNEHDASVGLYAVGKINKEIVKELNENCEGVDVIWYKDYLLELLIDMKYVAVIKLEEYDGEWQLMEVRKSRLKLKKVGV